jgi:hypothetical protein
MVLGPLGTNLCGVQRPFEFSYFSQTFITRQTYVRTVTYIRTFGTAFSAYVVPPVPRPSYFHFTNKQQDVLQLCHS